jgi:hypothetical protein
LKWLAVVPVDVAAIAGMLLRKTQIRSKHKQQGLSRRATNPLRERLSILRTWLSYLHVRAPVFLLDHMHLVF